MSETQGDITGPNQMCPGGATPQNNNNNNNNREDIRFEILIALPMGQKEIPQAPAWQAVYNIGIQEPKNKK